MLHRFGNGLPGHRRAKRSRKSTAAQHARTLRPTFESLEPRLVLEAGPLPISELTQAAGNDYFDPAAIVAEELVAMEAPGLLVNGETHAGGEIAIGDVLTMTNPGTSGTIYYTTDGTDPRLADGSIDPAAQVYANPLTLNGSALVRARIYDNGQFSTLSEADYLLPGDGPRINELVAVNDSGLKDIDGQYSDWIEISNPTGIPFDLDGWYLTDDNDELDQWRFPAVRIDPGELMVVFASGKDHRDPEGELHTSFSLGRGGEFLALVAPDGKTIIDAIDPKYPQQTSDVSYGTAQGYTPLLDDVQWKHHVPSEAEATAKWTAVDFDDSTWSTGGSPSPVLITEAGSGSLDYIEIQNVSGVAVDTSGWVVAVNAGTSGDVNAVQSQLWHLPETIAPGAVLYRTDRPDDGHYFGENIAWGSLGKGWAMIVDAQGEIVDMAAWSYTAEEIADLKTSVNGFTVRGTSAWTGAATDTIFTDPTKTTMIRVGDTDHNDASDFVFVPPDPFGIGQPNLELILPVGNEGMAAVGFNRNPWGFGRTLLTNVEPEMYEANASLWMRTTFDVPDPAAYVGLTLEIKYNDGFVAYLNGQEVARRNAPSELTWNSTATRGPLVDESWREEGIPLVGLQNLLREGENVLAIQGLNLAVDDPDFLIQAGLVGTDAELGFGYFSKPTPRERNGDVYLEYLSDTKFSVDRGFFDEPFELEITTETPDATIYYTTDGSRPKEIEDNLYDGPITIDKTSTIRAMAVKPGFRPTNIDTQTYIFPEQVIRQPVRPEGFPTYWGPAPADYEMDPDVVDDPLYSDIIRDSLRTHPTISLVMDPYDLWDPTHGIYANTKKDGPAWERDVSIELIDFPEGKDLQVDAGTRIHGSASRNTTRPKHNFRLVFRKEYGLGKLDYPLFGDTEVQSFNDLILRGGNGDSWFHPNSGRQPQAQYTHDQWHRDTQVAMGQPTAQQGDVHVYVNGLYWGFYHLIERPEASFMEEHFGGDKEDYDVLQHKGGTVDGSRVEWDKMMSMLRSSNLTTDEAYQNALQYVDPANLADYMLLNFYSGNTDWDHNNWYGARKRELGEGWKFFAWDSEVTFRNPSANITGVLKNNQPTEIHQRLSVNAEYKMLFADRAHKHLFNGGALTQEAVTDYWLTRADEIDEALVAESARWGDHHRPSLPYTVEREFRARQNELVRTWFTPRTNLLLSQLKSRGMYPNVVAPSFEVEGQAQHGGVLGEGRQLAITAPAGTIYYTLDGTDPRLPGGEVAPGAIVFDGMPLTLSENRQVKSRVLSGNTWSALNEAEFFAYQPASAENLLITEIHYNPLDPTAEELAVDPQFGNDDFEFVELQNVGTETIDLVGLSFSDGVILTLPDGQVLLDPDERVVVVSDPAAFEARFGDSATILGQYDANLSNSGERITLLDRAGEVIHNFVYNDKAPWPETADGDGFSLNRVGTDPSANGPSNWTAATPSPGSINERLGSVVGRYVFYNDSAWDGFDQAADRQDDQAIATDKQALLPGQTATPAHYTSYASGINGIIIDIAGGLDTVNLNAAEDFRFRVGNSNDTNSWSYAPQPNSLVVRPGEGLGGSDRVTIVWPDRWIKQQWLEVTVRATEHTALAEPDVFYFGNAIAESGDQAANTIVNATDEIGPRNFPHSATAPAPIDDPYDYNRDKLVDATDQIIARENQTNPRTMLRLITPTAVDPMMEQAAVDLTLADIDWLYEFEQVSTKRRIERPGGIAAAVDIDDFLV